MKLLVKWGGYNVSEDDADTAVNVTSGHLNLPVAVNNNATSNPAMFHFVMSNYYVMKVMAIKDANYTITIL